MRQVPHFLIIGRGRLARHLTHYFSLLQFSYRVWHRGMSIQLLQQHLHESTHVLLAIRDDAIDAFYQDHLQHIHIIPVHFSGSTVNKVIYGAHPLMTFHDKLYDLARYQSIPFIVDDHAPDFSSLLPGLPNIHVRLSSEKKAKYHALCVLSGNFSCILWQKLFDTFSNEFNIPSSFAHPYLMQQIQNLLLHPQSALTGPLVRQDHSTIENNLKALEGDPFQLIYKSFVDCYQQSIRED